ncbi:SRPBCC family protein [Ciceribacter azotifigens]|uniref:SRPBCC family protein n=1 Tax=Ciceribacter azotifigens TaxID=2069303 RepID=UPI003A839EA1
MTAKNESGPNAAANRTVVERTSERELIVRRSFNGPARLVFEAWTTPELLMRWWTPKSFGLTFISCELDARTGAGYSFVFGHPDFDQPMTFFGRYIDVSPHSRLVWTNEEGAEDGPVTTVTFEEQGAQTLVVMLDLYPSKQALDGAIDSGSTSGFGESFEQLDDLLIARDPGMGRSSDL